MPLMQIPPWGHNQVEPMQVDAPTEDNDNNEGEVQLIVENPTLDLDTYANSYTGLARLYRLIFISDVCPQLRVEALKMALNYVTTTYNVSMYQVLHKKLNEVYAGMLGNRAAGNHETASPTGGAVCAVSASSSNSSTGSNNGNNDNGAAIPAMPTLPDVAAQSGGQSPSLLPSTPSNLDYPPFDQNWVESRSKSAALKLEKLDSDLKNYKSNSIKESIRRGHDDLGDHYLSCGDLSNALKCYSRARDYCTSGKHVVNMCLNVIKVSIYLQNWSHVLSYASKAEHTTDFNEGSKEVSQSEAIVTRLKCATGLADLQMKKYKSAAKHFLQAQFDSCDFPEMLSASNVAMYGGLCALATFERQELQKQVISSSSFKLFLELEPQLRDIILKFHQSKYSCCLKLLDEIKDNLMLDMYLAHHVQTLYSKIRNRALIQYFYPYKSADMHKMAEAFNRSVAALENELMQLILEGQINARIDSHLKILYAKEADQRIATFERSLSIGREYERRSRMMVLRAAMLKAGICVKSIPRESGGSSTAAHSGSDSNAAPGSTGGNGSGGSTTPNNKGN